jgi:hypothetical protein
MGQSSVGTFALHLAQIPPGPGQVLVSGGTATTFLIGFGAGLTVTNGYPLPAGGLSIPLFAGGGGNQLYAISSAGSSAVSWLISNASGQTGL